MNFPPLRRTALAASLLVLSILQLVPAALGETDGTPSATGGTASLQPVTPRALPDVHRLLNYLGSLPDRREHRVISAQHCGRGAEVPSCYRDNIEALHETTGEWVAMIGADYGPGRTQTGEPDVAITNKMLIAYNRAGGLVTLCWHARNPWTRGSAWDTEIETFADLYTPGTAINQIWEQDLARVADGIEELRDAGVVVFWRPFHEMNGGWFWWGKREPQEFLALWRHLFAYFCVERGLDNLLWGYTPNKGTGRPGAYYYPGDDYCDIVGIDHYGNEIDLIGYDELVTTGKPICISEIGPKRGTNGAFDYNQVIRVIKERYPKIVLFQSWSLEWAMIRNQNAAALLADPWVLNRDDLDWREAAPRQE